MKYLTPERVQFSKVGSCSGLTRIWRCVVKKKFIEYWLQAYW